LARRIIPGGSFEDGIDRGAEVRAEDKCDAAFGGTTPRLASDINEAARLPRWNGRPKLRRPPAARRERGPWR